jgi:hypothetical protein
MSNLCRRRDIFSSRIAAVILSVASIGSTALADDCPLSAEPCACQSGPNTVQAHARQRPVLKRASAKSASAGVSKPKSVVADRKPAAASSD